MLRKKIVSLILITLTISIAFYFMSCLKPLSESYTDETAGFNGGFETLQKNLPVNWMMYTPKTVSSSEFELSMDSTFKKEGRYALHFLVKTCSAKGGHLSPGMAKEIEVQAGETYYISMWVYNKSATYRIALSGVNAKHIADKKEIESSEATPDWKQIEMEFKIPSHMNTLRLEFNVVQPGECWVDEITIRKK
jgi:hypothetical protein